MLAAHVLHVGVPEDHSKAAQHSCGSLPGRPALQCCSSCCEDLARLDALYVQDTQGCELLQGRLGVSKGSSNIYQPPA